MRVLYLSFWSIMHCQRVIKEKLKVQRFFRVFFQENEKHTKYYIWISKSFPIRSTQILWEKMIF